jgi:signal transduction histidine kinase
MRRCSIVMLFAWGLYSLLSLYAPGAHGKTIVMLYESEWRTPSNVVIDQVLRDELQVNELPSRIQYYTEFLENARFPAPGQEERFASFLRDRYSDIKVDVVIALDPAAVQFLIKYRDRLFPGTPVAFARMREQTLARLKPPADFLGTPYRLDVRPTIELALRLRPETREFVIVTGTTEVDHLWKEMLRAACAEVAPGVKTRVLTGLPIDDIVTEVSKLPPDAFILTGTFRRDGAGIAFPGVFTLLDKLRPVAPVPILHAFENAVGRGALGSVSPPIESGPRQAAAVAKQFLAGVAPGAVVLPPPVEQVAFIDWRELRRWDIPESRLPPDAVLRFREPTFWDQYRYHTLAVAMAVLLQTVVLVLLLVQRRQRAGVEQQLRQQEQSMKLAADAADLTTWHWEIEDDRVERLIPPLDGRAVPPSALDGFLDTVHEQDREAVERAIERALRADGIFEIEYRVVNADNTIRWFGGRGSVEYVDGKARRMRGVTLNITTRKLAELEVEHQRHELAHLSRVALVGELSGSMAHELNQPLMAILSNAQAAQMFIRRDPVDLVELGAILEDIVENDKHAGEIIWGLRKMLKKECSSNEVLPVNDLVRTVLRLMRHDLLNRHVTVESHLAPVAPALRGDRVQLQQVLVNLLLNACDAMASLPAADRRVRIGVEVRGATIAVKVSDRGCGIDESLRDEIFMPFRTTKANGLGLGLAVSKSIIDAHGGSLGVEDNAKGGVTFTLVLPAATKAFA